VWFILGTWKKKHYKSGVSLKFLILSQSVILIVSYRWWCPLEDISPNSHVQIELLVYAKIVKYIFLPTKGFYTFMNTGSIVYFDDGWGRLGRNNLKYTYGRHTLQVWGTQIYKGMYGESEMTGE
jgi:hypothetical protein